MTRVDNASTASMIIELRLGSILCASKIAFQLIRPCAVFSTGGVKPVGTSNTVCFLVSLRTIFSDEKYKSNNWLRPSVRYGVALRPIK